jgi:hypothetical protein
MNALRPPCSQDRLDVMAGQPQLQQLAPRDHPMLSGRLCGERMFDASRRRLCRLRRQYLHFDRHAPIVATIALQRARRL